ncbi:hypothetical protein GCM10022392_03520 [Mucilaginibacter panaciglaebae]|uniref:DUF5723 domain-containing protein n=1 Tax=Mucilaginibacter panaciglaebae TaxID=502331 RepID=A0ABP7WDN5_9SPHI
MYDSFENPSQRAFIPDTSKQIAFNFFIPNLNANFFVAGNGQQALKTRAFHSYYNTANLVTGQGAYNHLNANFNDYTIMLKVFTSENGDQEMGLALNTRFEGRAIATDETISFFNGFTKFPQDVYANVFNSNYKSQVYHQLSFTYREQIDKRTAIGFKLSALAGIDYHQLNITQSSATFNKTADQARLALQGSYRANSNKDESNFDQIFPIFINPGASVSFGLTYFDESGFKWQGNIKNLGFIHWGSKSNTNTFNGSALINNFSSADRESIIEHSIDSLTQGGQRKHGFITPTNGLLELSINRTYWLDDEGHIKFTPTLIGSKELFYNGFTAALVAPIQLGKHNLALTSSYNELKLFNLGFQYMKKSDDAEFFIGSERLFATGSFLNAAFKSGSQGTMSQAKTPPTAFTGMDFYIGASLKFGPLIERKMNSSGIAPAGDKGFFGKLWDGLFGKSDPNY